jgi:hypothetical protein
MELHRAVSEEVSMTEKRDFKRRVRERQAQTGESYMTAHRHVRAQAPSGDPISVVELIDITEIATPLGYKIRVTAMPSIVERIDVAATLIKFRDVLLATTRDRSLDLMRDVVLRGAPARPPLRPAWFDELREFLDRASAGLGGVSDGGTLVAMSVAGKTGAQMMLFHLKLAPDLPYVRRVATLGLGEVPDGSAGTPWWVFPW